MIFWIQAEILPMSRFLHDFAHNIADHNLAIKISRLFLPKQSNSKFTLSQTITGFHATLKLSSANALNLDKGEILSSGKGLKAFTGDILYLPQTIEFFPFSTKFSKIPVQK